MNSITLCIWPSSSIYLLAALRGRCKEPKSGAGTMTTCSSILTSKRVEQRGVGVPASRQRIKRKSQGGSGEQEANQEEEPRGRQGRAKGAASEARTRVKKFSKNLPSAL